MKLGLAMLLEYNCSPSGAKVQVQEGLSAGGRGLDWTLHTVERKLVPILREWDVAHPSPVSLNSTL